MRARLLAVVMAIICILVATPAMARENPYKNAGEVAHADIPVSVGPDNFAISDTSAVTFEGAGYTHTIGRVSIRMVPLLPGLDEKPVTNGNMRSSGTGHTIRYEVYRDLIKEQITLKSPETVSYSYDLRLSDWVTTEQDESRPEKIPGPNSTMIITYPYTKQVTNYAKDSTIDINQDRWGNLIVYVNGEDVVVMPKPFAIDATGKRFWMDFKLDTGSKTISLTGDLAGAQYPLVIDPTERVTNGGFEDGDLSGWTGLGSYESYSVVSGGAAHNGTYYLNVLGGGGYSGISQTINYINVTTVSSAVAIPVQNTYDIPISNEWIIIGDWLIDNQGQTIQDWTVRSANTTLTENSTIDIWTYSSTHGHVDSVTAMAQDPPVANFTGNQTTGNRPVTVQFTDASTGSPTNWSWDFENDGTIDSYVQSPQHTYNESGSYTVILTATNADGSDSETKNGYVTVAGYYYVYADGVGLYYDPAPQSPLYEANHTPVFFYDRIVGQQGGNPTITWQGVGNPVDNATGSRNWNINEDANTKANYADFAFHAGHGWDDGFKFGTENYSYDMDREDLSFGGNYGRAKWVALFTCSGLKESTHEYWESVFNGLHILMGFDTTGLLTMDQGTQFADRMMGNGTYYKDTIREAWANTLIQTIDPYYIKGAYMYAFPSQNDYLPGFGSFKQPEKDGSGNYNITYVSFNCSEV
jgi:PKD repeat protein